MAGLYDLKSKAFVWTRECSYKGKENSISGQGYQAIFHQASNESRITPYGTLIVEDGKCTMVGNDGNNLWQIIGYQYGRVQFNMGAEVGFVALRSKDPDGNNFPENGAIYFTIGYVFN